MATNVNVFTAITIQATNIASGTTPYNLALSGITLPVSVWSSSDFFMVQTGNTPIPLPAAIVYYAFVINLGTNPVTLTVTFNPASSAPMVLNPVTMGFGTFFWYAATAETSPSGITAMSAITTSSVTPVQYFVAA
jgi:hypothetical protein